MKTWNMLSGIYHQKKTVTVQSGRENGYSSNRTYHCVNSNELLTTCGLFILMVHVVQSYRFY